MDLATALLLTIFILAGYTVGYVIGWTDHRKKARR